MFQWVIERTCPVNFHSKRITAGGTAHTKDRVSRSNKSCSEIDRVSIINNSYLRLTDRRPESARLAISLREFDFFATKFLTVVTTHCRIAN